jgi:hypothetical protein
MVGLHDMVCIFLSGHRQMIKFSSKDSILMKHLAEKLIAREPDVAEYILWNDLLKDCDAYIAQDLITAHGISKLIFQNIHI